MSWKAINPSSVDSSHYSVLGVGASGKDCGLADLKELFRSPEFSIDWKNFVLFSTSGVHGSYTTIEEAEEAPGETPVTFLVIHARRVCLRYGVCYPTTKEDFDFLKALREASFQALLKEIEEARS